MAVMMGESPDESGIHQVTRILEEVRGGDPRATDRLLAAVYQELRRLAAAKISRERPGHTLQATALVHEAYLRIVGGTGSGFENRAHFFAAAAEAMRRILIESARRKARLKHGGGRERREIDEADAIVLSDPTDLLALDEALEKLRGEDETKAELVKLRYFAGLTVEQSGEILGISRATADRYWTFARAWLLDEMTRDREPE
jgi:RNA polymerase sigma factor (TIGR02999 family)